jgi:predicted phosphodiesterase
MPTRRKDTKMETEFGLTPAQLRRVLAGKKARKPKVIRHQFTDRIVRFGVVSDTHLCSTEERLDELRTFYDICKRKEGIEVVIHIGDLIAGQGVYAGQENELTVFGCDNQVAYAVENYPNGLKTYFITGNHDLSYWKTVGVDIGERVMASREDMVYLGQYQADLMLPTPYGAVKVRMMHPDGGGAYALSYKAQKIAEQIPSGQKPQILLLGHFHTSHYFFYRNIHILNAGSFEGQTKFILRKGINPVIGGWIVNIRLADDAHNSVVSIQPSFIPFF